MAMPRGAEVETKARDKKLRQRHFRRERDVSPLNLRERITRKSSSELQKIVAYYVGVRGTVLESCKAVVKAGEETTVSEAEVAPAEPEVLVLRGVGRKRDSHLFAGGTLVFGALLFVAGALPWALPYLYLTFLAVCLPWRVWDYCVNTRNCCYLLDFCYWANVATACFLVLHPDDRHWEAAAFALSDGPVAGALIVWQCAWVFGSTDHSVSVLIHLLPGLAIFAHKYCKPPAYVLDAAAQLGLAVKGSAPAAVEVVANQPSIGFFWLFTAPMLFYCAWQFCYWLLVQVIFRDAILRKQCMTSYTCLARRAAKTNNVWNRLVRRGGAARRVCMFGLIQLVFTVGTLLLFMPVYHSFALSLAWQVIKVVVPVWFGSVYQCERLPRRHVTTALKAYKVSLEKHDVAASA